MTWIAGMGLSLVVFAAAAWLHRRREDARTCPTCDVPYEVVAEAGDGPNTTYDILACDRCDNTATLVHGAQGHLAYCPACRNRALRTPSLRLPGGGLEVEVREQCELCGHTRVFTVGTPDEVRLGQVIPFPTERVRPDTGEGGA